MVCVDDLQYRSAEHQLEVYQATRQRKGLPKIDLKIVNCEVHIYSEVKMDVKAGEGLNQSLLTGE